MHLDLLIAGERLRITSSPDILAAVRGRYGAFQLPAMGAPQAAPIDLEILRGPGRWAHEDEAPLDVVTRVSGPDEVIFDGPVRGRFSIRARQGSIEATAGLGAADVLIRTTLSLSLPLGGALLLHGAALEGRDGGSLALCGSSGSGKSTAVTAFGGCCDELVVLRPQGEGLFVESTPYWRGRPFLSRCTGVVCLERGGVPGFRRLRGGSIARVLARHVVRYVAWDPFDRSILRILGQISERVMVTLASCPEGEAFLPFLEERIGLRRRVA